MQTFTNLSGTAGKQMNNFKFKGLPMPTLSHELTTTITTAATVRV